MKTFTDSADLSILLIMITNADGNVEHAERFEELAQYESGTEVQNEDNPVIEPNVFLKHDTLSNESGLTCSDDNYVRDKTRGYSSLI